MMRPFCTVLLALALALVALCSGQSIDVASKVAVANGGGVAALTPHDCKTLPTIPGKCDPEKCNEDCQDSLGRGYSVGECVKDGCQCTYCMPPRGLRS